MIQPSMTCMSRFVLVASLLIVSLQHLCTCFVTPWKRFSCGATRWSPGILMQSVSPTASSYTLRSTLGVDLGERSYPIYIGSGLLANGELLRKHVSSKRALIITNDVVAPLYLDLTVKAIQRDGVDVTTLVLPDGEEHKSMEMLVRIMDTAIEGKFDRTSTFVALGGGVIGDLVGFAAAVYQRGINFVQVPTTVMAMVDSSVGGKTSVNHPCGKNMIGSFHQPQCVLVDTSTLESLPDREYFSGLSEVSKYGLIRDADFFRWQERTKSLLVTRDHEAVAKAVEQSCINKAEVVAMDEREAGVRAKLNLGHTFGHAIEAGLGYGSLFHGEAVAIGIHMAAVLSQKLGWIDDHFVARIVQLLKFYNLPIDLPKGGEMDEAKFVKAMNIDKKVADGKLRLILLKGELGNAILTGDFDQTALSETINEFVSRQ